MGLAAFFLVLIYPFVYGYLGMIELVNNIIPGLGDVISALFEAII